MKRIVLLCCTLLPLLAGCEATKKAPRAVTSSDFADDVAFLRKHTPVIVLSDESGTSQVAVAPALQGRVMTSAAAGNDGMSFGWINRAYFEDVANGKTNPHIAPFGGEDRFWIGPEGGQFSIFFAKGATFDLDHWFTPKFIDTEPFETVSQSTDTASFKRNVSFKNYSDTQFDIEINRRVRLLSSREAWRALKCEPMTGVRLVAVQTDNRITNTSQNDWTKESGLLSIWILGMMNASAGTTVAIPVKAGSESELGPAVNDDYFGKVPHVRLVEKGNVVYFKADANFRSKIGISPRRVKPVMGSYDSVNKVLTVCNFTFNEELADYVNSSWKIQDNPFGGDVANSYNDGPPAPGKPQLGKFYELESSSAAYSLRSGESMSHSHLTIHVQGDESSLDTIARATLGVGLHDISTALP